MYSKIKNQYAVECHSKIATDCCQKGEYSDSEEEAKDWVENECWIFSGEGWICLKCHDTFMGSLTSHRKKQGNGLDGVDGDIEAHDGLDNDLETGIDIVR
jgi:hypothetical protein